MTRTLPPRARPAALALGLLGAAWLLVHVVDVHQTMELVLLAAVGVAVIQALRLRGALTVARDAGAQALLSGAQARALLANAPAAIYFRDREDRFVFANDTAARMIDPAGQELVGRTLDDLVPPEVARSLRAHERIVLHEGREIRHEQVAPHADGTDHTFLVTKFPVRDDDGAIVGLAGVTLDITDTKRAQEGRRAAEERFRGAFHGAPIGMAIVDLDGRYVEVNRALCQLLGRSEEDLLGRTVHSITHPDDVAASIRAIERALAGEQRVYQLEKRYLHLDGHPIWVTLHGTVIRDAEGCPTAMLRQVQDITQRRDAEQRLRHQADHDPLTGLLNRRRFEEEVEAAVVRGTGALMVLDLDHFKLVNDTRGHHAGDRLISAVAATLRNRLADCDVVARLGGDEFGILLPTADREEAEAVASAIVRDIEATVSGAARGVTCSLGIALLDPLLSGEQALVRADLAMYEAKENGRDRWAHYAADDATQPRMKTRLDWVQRLRDALDEERFVLDAQPILDLRTSEVRQHELLVRMRDDERGRILPGEFLEAAEQFDLVQELDRWVVGRAIDLIARHRAAGQELVLEVNLSGKSLTEDRLLALVERRLHETGVPASSLIFEITETAAIANMAAARRFAERLQALGCRFALDDFGAGFGSFYYLKHLPFDYLKIDGEFIRDCLDDETDRLVVAAVVDMATGMGKQTIAESVVDDRSARFLRRQGVDFAQGFGVGRPRPVEEILAV